MSRYLSKSVLWLVVVTGCVGAAARCEAARWYFCGPVVHAAPAVVNASSIKTDNTNTNLNQSAASASAKAEIAIYSSGSRVAYNAVQTTPEYDLRRPEVPSGARITLFANFLGKEPGVVLLGINGTSHECEVIDWKPQSVTIELPKLGLCQPKNATLAIILPDGRIAKTFRILFVAQPDIVVHGESVPQPLPPAPGAAPAAYATPGAGESLSCAGH